MKTFQEFLENHNYHLGEIDNMIKKQKEDIEQFVELNHERGKLFVQIIKTLEYGLKNEAELQNAIQKAMKLANVGYKLRTTDFSGWARNTGKYGGELRNL